MVRVHAYSLCTALQWWGVWRRMPHQDHVHSTEHPVPTWLNRMAGGVHSAITTYKAASLSMHHLSEQLHSGWKWMASATAGPPQLHACYSTPTLPSQEPGRHTSVVCAVPPRRGQDVLLEGTLGCSGTAAACQDDDDEEEEDGAVNDDKGHVDNGDSRSCLSPGDRLTATRSAPMLRDAAYRGVARP